MTTIGIMGGTSGPLTSPLPSPSAATTSAPAATAPPAEPVIASAGADAVAERLQVGTYNVAGGNAVFSHNFEDRTSNALAAQLVSGKADVVALQEVAVGNENAKGKDYNVEVMRDIFAQTYGLKDDQIKGYYLDDHGKRHALPEGGSDDALKSDHLIFEGGGHAMRITKESFDSQGNPVDGTRRPGDDVKLSHGKKDVHPITAYRAQLDNGQEYNAVFGDTQPGKEGYGNAVLLGPGFSFRDESGHVRPDSFQVRELGRDPELWKSPDERERRTALGVRFQTPRGQEASAFSAHLSTESISDARAKNLGLSDEQTARMREALPAALAEVQRREMIELEHFASDFGGDSHVVIGADANHKQPGDLYPGFDYPERHAVHAWDHLFTSRDVRVHDQHWVNPGNPHGASPGTTYSDHKMSIIDITM